MSSSTTPHVGHIGGNVGICTSGLSNPHPLGGFRNYQIILIKQSPANRQVELAILEKNVANLCLCHIKKCHHGS